MAARWYGLVVKLKLTIEAVKAIAEPAARARALGDYLEERRDVLSEARSLRYAAIRECLDAGQSQAAVAREAGVSLSTVRAVKEGRLK